MRLLLSALFLLSPTAAGSLYVEVTDHWGTMPVADPSEACEWVMVPVVGEDRPVISLGLCPNGGVRWR